MKKKHDGSQIVPISEVKVWDKNPRGCKKTDFARLKKQIQKFGVYKPLIACKENGTLTVLGGNMRLRALQELGHKEVWVSVVGPKSEAEKIEISLSDNDRVGYYEDQALAELVYPYREEINLEAFKVDLPVPDVNLSDILSRFAPEPDKDLDNIPEDVKPICKRGQIWQLGKHRLMCGDSTVKEDVERLMEGKKADALIGDPPYGINLDTDWSGIRGTGKSMGVAKKIKGKSYPRITGDDKPFDAGFLFDFWKTPEMFLFGADYYAESIPSRVDGSWLVWDKRKPSQSEGFGSEFELVWSRQRHKRRILRHEWFGFLREGEHGQSRVHPAQKSLALIEDLLSQWCGDFVIDPFVGSGTTLIACEHLNRICYGMEIEPKYCDVTIARWEDLTGKKAKLVGDVQRKKARK